MAKWLWRQEKNGQTWNIHTYYRSIVSKSPLVWTTGQADIMLLYKATEQRVFQSWRLICQCPPSWERRVATVATKHPASKPCCKEISAFEDIGLRFPDFRNAIRRCAALRKQSWEGLFRSFVYTSLLLSTQENFTECLHREQGLSKSSAITNLTNQGSSATQKLERGVATTKKSHILGNDAKAS